MDPKSSAWDSVLERAGGQACLAAAVAVEAAALDAGAPQELALARLSPVSAEVFAAFGWTPGPAALTAIIVGQDPYFTESGGRLHADGHAFSVREGPETTCPPSLRNVLRAAGVWDGAGHPPLTDLRSWAAQGVLLLNTALTVRRGGPANTHKKAWAPLVRALAAEIAAARTSEDPPLQIMLWGGQAQSYRKHLARIPGAAFHSWSHPSVSSRETAETGNKHPPDTRFAHCDNFRAVNAARAAAGLLPIVWDPRTPSWAAFDGSAVDGKGTGHRWKAAAGSVVATGSAALPRSTQTVPVGTGGYGVVEAATAPQIVLYESAADGTVFEPSNNRGELLGFATTLGDLLWGQVRGTVEIVSDSKYTLDTVTKWLPARLDPDAPDDKAPLKNMDLLMVCHTLLERLRAQTTVVRLRWVKAHTKGPDDPKFRYDALAGDPARGTPAGQALASWLWRLNDLADKVATT